MTHKERIFDNFADWLRRRDCSDTTVKHYLSDLRQLVAWFQGRVRSNWRSYEFNNF